MATPFRRKQLFGVACSVLAAMVVGVTYAFVDSLFGFVGLPKDDPANRLAFAARWLIGPGLMLLAGIHAAGRRGFYPDAIDGTRFPENRSLEINLRYNTNTVEQLLLLTIALAALSVTLPIGRMILIPAISTLFVAGRVLFWAGYLLNPMARAFGMVLTALPTLLAYVWLVFF